MSDRKKEIVQHRAMLVVRAANQRAELANSFAPFRAPLAIADKGLHAVQFFARHPVLMAGAVALAVVVLPKHWFVLFKNGWLAWRMALAARRSLGLNE